MAIARVAAHNPLPLGPAVQVLCYHRINAADDGLSVMPHLFKEQMAWLAEHRRDVPAVRIDDAVRSLATGVSDRRSVVVTFDDGWADAISAGLPILAEHGFPAVSYLTTDFIGSPGYASRAQILEAMSAGVEIGCHTASHPDLRTCNRAELRVEIDDAKADLEDRFGVPVTSFAYPTGLFDDRTISAVRAAGFRTAVTCRRAWLGPRTDPLAIPRNTMENLDAATFAAAVGGGLNYLRVVEAGRRALVTRSGPRSGRAKAA